MITILLIEDDEADKLIFKRYLKQVDYETTLISANTIKDAINSVKDVRVDVAFCDYNLPDGSAIDFLKDTGNWEDFPVVVITSIGDVERATESLKNGAFDFITKDNINPPGLLRTLQNVERYRQEQNLRQSLERKLQDSYINTKSILDNSPSNIWSLNKEGKIIVLNQRAKRSFKQHFGFIPNQETIFFDQIPLDISDRWKKLFDKALEGETVGSIEKFEDEEGHYFLQTDCSPILDDGVISGAIFFLIDVTENQIAQSKVRESERNFRAIFEGSELPIIVEELETNTIIDLNQAAADLHGYKREQMVGMSIYDTIPPDHLNLSQENYQLHLKGEMRSLDSFIYTADKRSIPVNIELNQIKYDGRICNLLFMQDISLQKETQNRLEEARKLAEQTAEFKSAFLANMSHEIRTPMNAMIGFTDLLKKTSMDDEQSEFVEIIEKAGEDLLVIINDILDISKIQAGKMELRESQVDISDLLNKVIQLHKYKAEDKGLSLELALADEMPEFIITDPTRLSQILNNLVSNAIKFTDNGRVELSAQCLKLDADFCTLRFSVADTGIGIPQDKIGDIFTDFSQIDSSLQRTQRGTGLGLAIVQELAGLLNTHIEVESEEEIGTIFHMTIGFKLADPNFDNSESQLPLIEWEDLEGMKLLVVEDNEVNTILAQRVLSKMNLEVVFASNGKEAVDLFESFDPDMIFMDIQMPIMNGFEATRIIRSKSNVPIIAMTAHVLDEERRKCGEVGMNGFIPKPFKKDDILKAIGGAGQNLLNPDESDIKAKEPIADLGWNNLTELADGDVEFAKKLLTTFVKNSTAELGALEMAKENNNLDAVKYYAHKMRSAFIMLEFNELIELSRTLESDPKTGPSLDRFINLLHQRIEEVTTSIERLN